MRRAAGATAKLIEFESSGRRAAVKKVELPIDGRARSPAWPTRRSPSRSRSAACSPPAPPARNASSSRCSATRSAGWRRARITRRSARRFAAFRESGFEFKELLIALVRSPQFLEVYEAP